MGKLIIKNHIIDPDAKKILYRLRDAATRPLLHDIDKAGDNIVPYGIPLVVRKTIPCSYGAVLLFRATHSNPSRAGSLGTFLSV